MPVEKCKGCVHAHEKVCEIYVYPEPKWEAEKTCPMATNIKKPDKISAKLLDPIKASKRKIGGK
jgi:hypothetical protein